MLQTLSDREALNEKAPTSMFRLRLSILNNPNVGFNNNYSRVTSTPIRSNRDDPPSSPPDLSYNTPVAPRRHYSGELNSSPISDEHIELLRWYNRATSHTERASTTQASTNSLKDHVRKYFKNCSDDGRYNMIRDVDEDIQRYFQRMVDDAMEYWKSGPVTLKEVAKSVLSVPGSNAYVERVFSGIKDMPTDRRHKLTYDSIQRLAMSKFALKYNHLSLKQIERQFIHDYVEGPYSELGDNEQNESDIDPTELFEPEFMFRWADVRADGVIPLKSVAKDDYFRPQTHDKIKENLDQSGHAG